MNKEHFTNFGSLKFPGGAIYVSYTREGMIQNLADILITELKLKGEVVTLEDKKLALEISRKTIDELDIKDAKKGVPNKLKALLEINKKSKAIKYCKNLELSEDELYLLIHNSTQIGFKCRSKFAKYIPSHLKLTDLDISRLRNNQLEKFRKKVKAIFSERRHISAHFFERGNQWHCFYFAFQDLEPTHWRCSHLHYVSYLWPQLTKKRVWTAFDKRSTNIPGNIHIRLIRSRITESPNNIK
jgi:hypothetical protein